MTEGAGTRPAQWAMNTADQQHRPPQGWKTGEWEARLARLHETLRIAPGDIETRGLLAALLEEIGEAEGALYQWRRLHAYDPNNLQAWEGIARCLKNQTDRAETQPDTVPRAPARGVRPDAGR